MFFQKTTLGIDFIDGDFDALDSLFGIGGAGAGKTQSDTEMIRFCWPELARNIKFTGKIIDKMMENRFI